LSEDEKYLFARSLAASQNERWQMHENFLRSHDLFTRSGREKYERILRSKKVVGRPKDLAHLPLLEQTIKLGKQSRAKT
jgi:hypothetical protein